MLNCTDIVFTTTPGDISLLATKVVFEPGETEAAKRASAAADAAFEATIENTVEEFVETLPTAKREKLVAEVEQGLDVAVVRQ
mgnify:CR=1 FL=1